MSKGVLMPVLCLFLGIGGGVLGGALAGGGSSGGDAGGVPSPGGSADANLARRVALLEERASAAPTGAPAPIPAPALPDVSPEQAGPRGPDAGGASLLARIERLEMAIGLPPEDVSRLTTEDIRAYLKGVPADSRALLSLLEELVRRDLPEPEARELRFRLGFLYRSRGRHGEEEALFRELARTLPQDTDYGQNAVAQLAWSRYHQKDLKDAGRILEGLSENPAASDTLRTNCIFQVGRMAREDGDLARSRAFLERLVGPEAASVHPTQQHMIAEAKRILADMEGK